MPGPFCSVICGPKFQVCGHFTPTLSLAPGEQNEDDRKWVRQEKKGSKFKGPESISCMLKVPGLVPKRFLAPWLVARESPPPPQKEKKGLGRAGQATVEDGFLKVAEWSGGRGS